MADDGEYSKTFLQSQETFQRAPEAQAEHRFPARASGVVEVPLGSRGPRSLYLRRNGDTFGFTLRHFIIYPPESLTETDGRHAAVGALLTPMDTIFVKEVAERGPAKQAGLHRGDRILYVNGESVSNLTYSELVHKIQTSPTYLHLLVVPKEEDILQKYFADTAHNPLSNKLKEDRRRTIQQPQGGFQVDAVSWRSLQNPSYSSIDYGRYVPQRQLVVDNSTDSIYSYGVPERSSENIYSTPRDTFRPNDRKSLEIYAEPVINDSTQRPRAQPQVPLYRKMGRRASEGSSTAVSETEYSLSCEDIDTTMKSSKAPYTSTDTFNSLEMPALMYSNVVGCRLSLDAGNRRESTSSLHSYESSSTLAGQDTDTDSIVMSRLRKSVQEKEEFMRRSSRPSELIQREFYSRPKKLEKPVWPPIDPQESPSRLNKPTHHNFQRVKNDIDNEREIIHNLDNKRSNTAEFLGKIQENENGQTNGTNASDTEDRRNYPPNIQMVSKRARQFESGRLMTEDDPIMNDRTSFYRSELARLSAKKAVPNVAVRTREFETMSSENFPRRDTSSSSTNSASVLRRSYRDSRSLDSSGSNCSLSSSAAEISKPFPGNFSIPIGSKFIHCPLPSDYKPTQDLPSNANQSNRMRQRSNSTGSCVAHMHTETSADTNNSYSSDSATTTGRAESLDTKQSPFLAEPYFNLIPESVEQLHRTPCVSVTPPSPIPQPKSLQTSAVRPNQLDLGAPKRPLRHLRAPQTVAADTPPPVQSVCNDKPLVVRRIKNTNITDEDRVTRRESYLRATEGGRIMSLESRDFSDGDVSPQVLRSAHRRWRPPLFLGDIQQLRKLFEEPSTSPSGGSLSGGSSSSVSLEREKITSCVLPVEKEKAYFVKEGLLHCKITEIDGKRFGDRSWKQVWAVLKGPKLFLYKDRHHLSPVGTSEVADQSLASGVDLRGSCVQVAGDYTKRKHVLRLSSVIPCRSELLLQAENPAHLAEWFQAFQEQSANSTEIEAKLNQIAGADKQRAMPQAIPATTSIQEPQTKSKLTSLRNRSPTGQSPVSKTRKPSQINDPSTSPKSKTWRGRFSKQLKRIHQSASSPNSPTAPEGSTFGNPLEHCLPSRYNSCVPRLVETCTEIVERKGLEIVGIYRVPGNSAAVTALTEEVNKCYDEVPQIDERWKDIHVVSSLLKSFFRKMPDPLVTSVGYTNFVEADKIEDPTSRVNEIRRLVKSLPPHNYNTLRHLIMHLKRVAEHSDSNKMEVKNLAIVFGPTIVRTCSNDMEAMVTDMTNQCKIVESLLTHADWFFADDEGEDLELPAPIATGEIFTNEPEINTALLKDNISKVGGHTKDHKMRKSWTSKYKRKNTKAETKTDASSPNGFKEFIAHSNVDTRNSNKTDLKESTSEHKPNIIPTTVTEMEGGASRVSEASKDESRRRIGSFIQENLHDAPFNYKKGNEDFRRRVENFIQETQSQLQRPRKPETSSNNSLEMRTNPISSSASNVRLSLAVNPTGDQRTITKTHSASNVFSRPINVENGRNTIGGSTVQCFKPTYYYNLDDRDHTNSAKDSCSDVSSTSSDSRCKPSVRPSPFLIRRGSSENLNITSNGNLKKIKYESESDGGQKMGSSDSLNKLSADDGGDLLTSITKIFDEKISSSHKQSPLTMENIPFVDESPEKISRLPINAGSYVNKENIPGSPKTYRNPSLHKSQYSQIPKFLTSNYVSAKQKEKQEDKEKDEDSTMCLSVPDNERHLNKKVNILGSKLKRSESLNKPERTASPLSNKLKRSESLNKATEKLKRSDSLTKYEKTESNISKKREINSGLSRRTTKDFAKLKRKNGMPERSIKRRHTVGGTKDPDKVNLLDNRRQEELSDVNENTKEKNLRTSSPDLSSTRRDRYLFEVNLIGHENMVFAYQHLIRGRPQSFPESSVYKLPLESHV